MILFKNDLKAIVHSRPNRFIIMARTSNGLVRVHCPNPGRMEELIFPGAEIILEKRKPGGKTDYSAEAVVYRKHIIPINSQKTNNVVRETVLPIIFPEALKTKSEYTMGKSRLDFLVTDITLKEHLIEIKSCTLVEHNLAMFPDAPSERALRHLNHMSEKKDMNPLFIFAVMNSDACFFAPNRHTQPEWAKALYLARNNVQQRAFNLSCSRDGVVKMRGEIPVIYPDNQSAEKDSGVYVISMFLPEDKIIETGKLGRMQFRKGYYLYVGKAMGKLTARMARHCRRNNKKLYWHIDYLRKYTNQCKSWPIRSSQDLECDLAKSLEKIYKSDHKKFGSTDCSCYSHLFYSSMNPAEDNRFISLINSYRHRILSE